jgi:hypothetical protein
MADAHTNSMIADLLAGLGIAGAHTQDLATQAVLDYLSAQNIVADIAGIRWGCLSIEADSINAARAEWHREALETLVRTTSNERITRIRFRVVHQTGGAKEPS